MEHFFQQLKTLKAYRKDRELLAQLVLENPDHFEKLLKTCFKFDKEISYKAAWILEMVCLKNLHLLAPHISLFLENSPKVYKPQAVRPFAKICEEITLSFYSKNVVIFQFPVTKKQREQLIEICFDWLITEQKVAVKAYAMQCLFLLGNEFDWVNPELKIILEKDFHHQQPAFKARARHILKEL